MIVAAGGENSETTTTKQMTDSSFRKSLYALEQWPSAIEGLQNKTKPKEFVNFFCSLIDRTVSELEVISSLLDRHTKKQEQQSGNSKSTMEEEPATTPTEEKQQKEPVKRQHAEVPSAEAQKPPTVVKKARMKYTPLRKPSV